MNTFIVGLAGFAGSGKDTAARFLAEALSARQRTSRCMAFADPIRQALLSMGVPSRFMTERELKEQEVPGFGASYRKLAQTLGTEWGRNLIGGDLWVRLLEQRMLTLGAIRSTPQVLIITDVRMQNEADWITSRGGILVRVDRPGVGAVRMHTSEAPLAHHDRVLSNDGDLANLRARCGQLCDYVLACMALEN